MKVLRISIIVALITVSCNQKSVQLPTIDVIGIQDTIYNNSKIWIFYNMNGNDTIAELNKNNSVANTHWIFNIDKRLTLKQVIPVIQQLQVKKEKPTMHDNGEISHSYFSYVDTVSNKFSLVEFDSIKYITYKIINKDSIVKENGFEHLWVRYNKNGIHVNNTTMDFREFNLYLTQHLDSIRLNLHLNFDKNLSYQNYIHLKAILQNIKSDSIIIDNKEFVDLE